jgi:hypothetical protein
VCRNIKNLVENIATYLSLRKKTLKIVVNGDLFWLISFHLSLHRFVLNGLLAGYNAEYQNSCYPSRSLNSPVLRYHKGRRCHISFIKSSTDWWAKHCRSCHERTDSESGRSDNANCPAFSNYFRNNNNNNLDWGPVPHFCPLGALQPVWLTPEVYWTIPVFLIVPTLAARCLSRPQPAVVP